MNDARAAKEDKAARIALAIGLIACAMEILISWPLFFVHAPEIRPMKWVRDTFLTALISLSVVLPFFIRALWGSKRRLAVCGLLLALAPLPLGKGLLLLASRICGFTLEE